MILENIHFTENQAESINPIQGNKIELFETSVHEFRMQSKSVKRIPEAVQNLLREKAS